jgi:hypothetical protein
MTIPVRELRAWAEGDYPTEAAVELLIRAKGGRFARESQPWIQRLGPSFSLCRVDWNRLHNELGAFSGGERRILNVAVSMGSREHPVDLSNNLAGLDDDLLLLVLAATAHAAGRPRLLSPATAVATPAAPTRASSPTHGSNDSTDPPRHRPVRRPEDERWAEDTLSERGEGPLP